MQMLGIGNSKRTRESGVWMLWPTEHWRICGKGAAGICETSDTWKENL